MNNDLPNILKQIMDMTAGYNDKSFTDTIYDKKNNITDNLDQSFLTKGEADYNKLFEEIGTSIDITNKKQCKLPKNKARMKLYNKLMSFEELDPEDLDGFGQLLSNSTMNNDYNLNQYAYELKKRIDNSIGRNFNSCIGGPSLEVEKHGDYLTFTRKNCTDHDCIRPELLKKPLTFLKWQYGKSINYDAFKYMIIQNKFQKGLARDQAQISEVKDILSQEYIVALQPDPIYLLWCLKRLIFAWYADEVLYKEVRKIKVLINQSKTKSNKRNGSLPSIVIYPNYGISSMKTVTRLIDQYFFFYKPLGYKNSHPSYFTQINQLVYYSNGLNDLKTYFMNVSDASNGSVMNDKVFTEKYTKLYGADDPFDVLKKLK